MGAERRRRRAPARPRRRRRDGGWIWLLVGVVLGVALVLWLHPRSLPAPPLTPPRLVEPRPQSEPARPDGDASPRSGVPGRLGEGEPSPPAGPVKVAIVIDDLGDNLEMARGVLGLEPPVTVAVLPFRPASRAIAAAAIERGCEVILHLPLEPERSAAMAGARGFLRTAMAAEEIEHQLGADLAAVPYIVGVNGHMGSRFTQDSARMETLLAALRARGLFFLDSRTSGGSVAAMTATRVGVPFAERTLFLDHDTAADAVAEALDRLTAAARAAGEAIAIGHPHSTTIAALRRWLPAAAAQGIAIVPASQLAR